VERQGLLLGLRCPILVLLDSRSSMCQRDVVVRRVLQILAMVLLAALVVQATWVSPLFTSGVASGDACAERCADGCPQEAHGPGEASESEPSCPPDCQFCLCCGLAMRAILPAVAVSLLQTPSTQLLLPFQGDRLRPSPEPRDIPHVPKLTLA
jgi:hypothetical protein